MKRRLYRGNPSDALKTPDPLPFTFCSGGSFALFTDSSLPMVKQAWRVNPVSGLNVTPHYDWYSTANVTISSRVRKPTTFRQCRGM